jgi:hypothetical protein
MDRVSFDGNVNSFSVGAPKVDKDGKPKPEFLRVKFCVTGNAAQLAALACRPEAAAAAVAALHEAGGQLRLDPNGEAWAAQLVDANAEVSDRRVFLRRLLYVAGLQEDALGEPAVSALVWTEPLDREALLWFFDRRGQSLDLTLEPMQKGLPLTDRKPEDDPALLRAAANLAPKPGSGIDRIEISAQGHEPVVLDQAAGKRLRARAAAARKQPKLNRLGTKNLMQRRRKGAPA